jgi:hypothetical protein
MRAQHGSHLICHAFNDVAAILSRLVPEVADMLRITDATECRNTGALAFAGGPPKRAVIAVFDNMEKAQEFAAYKELELFDAKSAVLRVRVPRRRVKS